MKTICKTLENKPASPARITREQLSRPSTSIADSGQPEGMGQELVFTARSHLKLSLVCYRGSHSHRLRGTAAATSGPGGARIRPLIQANDTD